MLFCNGCGALAWLLLAATATQAADRSDFSGVWVLTATRGSVNALPDPPGDQLKVNQSDGTLRLESRVAEGDGPLNWTYVLGRGDSRNKNQDYSFSTVLKWEGDALLFNTIANSAVAESPHASYTQMDRWELSRDGSRLTIRRQVVDRSGQVEAELTYTRP